MAFMAAALPYISAAASIGTALGQGQAESDIARIQAGQLEKQAVADEANAVQTAKFERRKAEMASSRVRAVASAGGSDVSSVDIQQVLSEIDEQGEYNALASIYSGQTSAASKRYAAAVAMAEGAQAKRSGMFKVGGTILGTIENIYG